MDTSGESIGESAEIFGELGLLMDRLNESRHSVETVITESIHASSGPAFVANSFSRHVDIIREVVGDIFEDQLNSNQEKAQFVATILSTDDKDRVRFLGELAGETEAEAFVEAYPPYEKFAKELEDSLEALETYGMNIQDFADGLITTHVEGMEMDLRRLYDTKFANTKLQQANRGRQNMEQIKFFAAITGGTALGSLIAKAIWELGTKRRK